MESFSLAETASGKVRGRLADGVHSFKGVRYGATTAGKNDFARRNQPSPGPAFAMRWILARPLRSSIRFPSPA